MNEAQFKTYCQNQPFLLPPNIEEMIPEGHVVKVMNKIIDKMNISEIINTYKGGGTTAYHPVMMLKVVIYGYMEGVYTSRKIGKALKENINFMWLSGMQRPNFRTINEFRSNRLKRTIKEIFKEVVKVAMELGLVDLEKMFVDGTKIEANANRYKIV